MPNARPCRTIAIEEQRRPLCNCIVLHKKFLELVDEQQGPRHRLRPALAFVTGHILHAELAEQIATSSQLLIDALQHAQRKLAVTLDRDHLGMRQMLRCVAFELNALLEIDEIELHLVRGAG